MADIETIIPFILRWEGGFANDPADRGGATNKGVTIATFQHYYGRDKTIEELRRITDSQWRHIFRCGYWDRWRADEIESQPVANILVDWVWGSGVWGVKIPQRILGVASDGAVGDKTLAAVNSADPRELFGKIKAERELFLRRIVERNPTQSRFIKGWINRLESIKF